MSHCIMPHSLNGQWHIIDSLLYKFKGVIEIRTFTVCACACLWCAWTCVRILQQIDRTGAIVFRATEQLLCNCGSRFCLVSFFPRSVYHSDLDLDELLHVARNGFTSYKLRMKQINICQECIYSNAVEWGELSFTLKSRWGKKLTGFQNGVYNDVPFQFFASFLFY